MYPILACMQPCPRLTATRDASSAPQIPQHPAGHPATICHAARAALRLVCASPWPVPLATTAGGRRHRRRQRHPRHQRFLPRAACRPGQRAIHRRSRRRRPLPLSRPVRPPNLGRPTLARTVRRVGHSTGRLRCSRVGAWETAWTVALLHALRLSGQGSSAARGLRMRMRSPFSEAAARFPLPHHH